MPFVGGVPRRQRIVDGARSKTFVDERTVVISMPKALSEGDDSDRGSWFAPLVGHSGSTVEKVARDIVDYFIENNPRSKLPSSGEYDLMDKWASSLCCVCALNPVQLKNKLVMAYEASPKSKSAEETAADMLDRTDEDMNQKVTRFASMANGKGRSARSRRSGSSSKKESKGLSPSPRSRFRSTRSVLDLVSI